MLNRQAGSGLFGRVQSTHPDRSNSQKSKDLTGKERFLKENSWLPKTRGEQSSSGKKNKCDSRSPKPIRISNNHDQRKNRVHVLTDGQEVQSKSCLEGHRKQKKKD
ncbi:hypothetical protein B9Z55_015439 [Caenorhabditis nigoni]|uniref:Uncharacterized protein n=1 Tax=Caenorhabditis nigoni TaxID=1611254 RepID=A0A2G5UAH6_9PELO|nr:hypothetical protein B9Z55_015439 [Caenorhabditis nigoni]